ncbi:MAG: DUF2520 domain-containing protein [Bacteroidia bacterium]|nr:DUF2520 domain-containing protein [Bacteroidia bacterium]MDW8134110.1 DUF2520 domain-containing protein [Bacteroidia bacterium]
MILVIGAGGVGRAIASRLSALQLSVILMRRPYQSIHEAFPTVTDYREVPWAKVEGVFLCVRDSQIVLTATQILPFLSPQTFVIHTAGSVRRDDLLQHVGERAGVIYPLQTFTPGYLPEWGTFPVFWEGNLQIKKWAELLVGDTKWLYYASSEERLRLHIGAVFTANFLNAFFAIAASLAHPVGDWRLFLPLAEKVIEKLHKIPPLQAQTGPARRGDIPTLEKHLHYLEGSHPELAPIYKIVTEYIRTHLS